MNKFTKALLFAVALFFGAFTLATGQVSIPYTFSSGTTIRSSEVNANFSTLGSNALNRTGGTVTGTLTSSGAGFSGSWSGSPTLSGNPTFSGTPVFSNVPTFSAGLGAISGTTLALSGAADFNGNIAQEAKLQNYRETLATPSIATTTLTLDLSTANVFRTTLNANIATLTISNPPATGTVYSFTLILDITGSNTVSWPASVKWGNIGTPTLTTTNGKVDIFTFVTTDGGTSWYGFAGGQNF